jgi:5-methylcytosine-specific restriction endonuclease McrBC regulatory subunit McrC
VTDQLTFIALGEHALTYDIELPDGLEHCYFKNVKQDYRNRDIEPCFKVTDGTISSHYYIGVDWISRDHNYAIHVSPKLNTEQKETAYLKMLLTCLQDPEATKHVGSIYEIKSEREPILIDQSEDLLSPLLAIHYVQLVKRIVQKGLRKTYYRETKTLQSRVKGKLLVSQTIKHHTLRNEPLKAKCSFDVFGVDHPENQLLKAALIYVKTYLSQFPEYAAIAGPALQYCLPAFREVNVPKDISSLKHFKTSPFFANYKQALSTARIVLNHYSHSTRSSETGKIKTLPYWINMALLFELYVFTLLRKEFGNQVIYQFKSNYQELDFLLNTPDYKLVIDTKYKPKYEEYNIGKDDIRQLSGYARMKSVYTQLNVEEDEVIKCLVIYARPLDIISESEKVILNNKQGDNRYVGFYKLGVSVPEI